MDSNSAICVGHAEIDQEGLHEHVSDKLHTQADRDDGDVQSIHWTTGVGDGRRVMILDGGRGETPGLM